MERLSGKSIFEATYYRESQLTRLVNLFAHVDIERWRLGMKVLEVGAGLGHLGDAFADLGFDVTSTTADPNTFKPCVPGDASRLSSTLTNSTTLASTESTPSTWCSVLAFCTIWHIPKFLEWCGRDVKILLLETAVATTLEQ